MRTIAISLLVGCAYIADVKSRDALSKIARYTTSLERNLIAAVHELERLQARRQGSTSRPRP